MVAEWQGLWSLHLRRRYTPAYFHSRFARGQALCLMCPSKKVRLESSLAKDRSDSLSVSSLFSSLTLTTLVPGRTSTVAFVSFSVERPKIRFFRNSSIPPHPPLVEYSVQIHGARQTSYPTCCPLHAHRCLRHHFRRQRADELGNRQGLARCHQQMDMVGHQHVGVSLAVVPLSRLVQAIEVAV